MTQHASNPKGEHGTTRSYVIGFILSLIFTAIPYYLVVNRTISGTSLLAVILGFAVLQMLVQVFFFLHLGRGPKPLYNIVFFAFTVITIMVVAGGSIFIMNNLHYNMSPADMSKKLIEKEGISELDGKRTGACEGKYATHKVTISEGIVSPAHTTAKHCDRLIFINDDENLRELTFGRHPEQAMYAGESEVKVRKGRAKTIILYEDGAYQFHDRTDPAVTGTFTVLP